MTGSYLLDINVLVALMWPAHVAHETAQNWFRQNARSGWATCPMTQAGFVRIVSNPAFSSEAVAPKEATDLLETNLRHPDHHFWADDMSFVNTVQLFLPRLSGHKQVMDAYLLGLASRRKGKLVSLDRGILDLLPDKKTERDLVVILT